MRHILFVCGKNRRRSPTAEAIFSGLATVEVSSAGTAKDADCPVSSDLLVWADEIFVMEKRYARQLQTKFAEHLRGKRVVNLGIPDCFELMQPELIALLEEKLSLRLQAGA
jgi:predicted protein tyrosine phosphatase